MPTEHPNVVLSRQHFDLMADQYDELFVAHMHAYDITHEMILTMLPFPRESALRVLELGTGTGNLTQKLLDRFPRSRVVGYDVSAEMLARARAKLARASARVQLHQGDISHIAFPGPFDAAISAIACTTCRPRPSLSCFIASMRLSVPAVCWSWATRFSLRHRPWASAIGN
jgi:tRNA (cmo5U34)-methyltransferase